jgi:hypothetical protein
VHELSTLRLWIALVVILGSIPLAPSYSIRAQDADSADPLGQAAAAEATSEDYEVPGGRFYPQMVLGREVGAGFAVYDGQGAALWTAFQTLGGVEQLGYPISRRFDWDGIWSQEFEGGVVRWLPEDGMGEVVPRDNLPDELPPASAMRPELPWTASSQIERVPWSGWWWPSNEALGRPLFAVGGPLDKYDQYVGRALGENPQTRDWERRENSFPGNRWAGHCNGWAAAALLEPEPTTSRTELGVTFSVGDQKGLLTYFHFADSAAWTFGEGGTVQPPDFHRVLLNWMSGEQAKGFVLTFDMGGGEVWSYPAYGFESTWTPDPTVPYRWRVRTTLRMADMEVPIEFVGTRPYPGPNGKVFEYTLDGDPENGEAGNWIGPSASGRFAHPGRVWYPSPAHQNLDRQWISPEIDRGTIMNILGWSPDPLEELLALTLPDSMEGSEAAVAFPDEAEVGEED